MGRRSSQGAGLWTGWLLIVAIAAVHVDSAHGLYQDQVGMWDWHQQYAGNVKKAVFQTSGHRKQVFVATESSVLAAMNLRTGQLVWKHKLADRDVIDEIAIASQGRYLYSLSGGGTMLRAWSLVEGSLVWETALRSPAQAGSLSPSAVDPPGQGGLGLTMLPFDVDGDGIGDLLLLSGGTVFAISSTHGGILWQRPISTSARVFWQLSVSPSKKIYAVGFSGVTDKGTASGAVALELDSGTGVVVAENEASAVGEELLVPQILVSSTGVMVACMNAQKTKLLFGQLENCGQSCALSSWAVSSLRPHVGSDVKVNLVDRQLDQHLLLSASDGSAYVLRLDKDGAQLAHHYRKGEIGVASNYLEVEEGKKVMAFLQQEWRPHLNGVHSGQWMVRAMVARSWDSGPEGEQEVVGLPSEVAYVDRVFLNSYLRRDKSRGYRFLVVTKDGALCLLQQGEVVWKREEALASIMDVQMVDPPPEKGGLLVSQVEDDLLKWLKEHLLTVKSTLHLATEEETAAVAAQLRGNQEKSKMVRDPNGFRKLIVVLTQHGKLFALHTGDGRIVWSNLLSSLQPDSVGRVRSIGFSIQPLKLILRKVPHGHIREEPPLVEVWEKVALAGKDSVQTTISEVFDAHSGKLLSVQENRFAVNQLVSLPWKDASESRLLMVIDDEQRVHLHMDTAEARAWFESYMDQVFVYDVEKTKGVIKGYGVVKPEGAASDSVYQLVELWAVSFAAEVEVINEVAVRKPDEAVHLQARVLGDRSVLFKYLYKNMMFVATVSPGNNGAATASMGQPKPEDARVTVYLINTVTGHVLHSVVHEGSMGPVHAVFSENWVVYHFFNLRRQRYEVSVLEMYEESQKDMGVLKMVLGTYNKSVVESSLSLPPLVVMQQSYYFLSTVKTIAVTTTARGITAKQLLIATVSDQILSLDKRYFDPRRPLIPTAADREEGLMPYTDTLPVPPQSHLTHGYQVMGIREIVTVPTRLESTCLVFVYGVDLFFMRTAPSKMYDTLSEDFSYALLIITIVVLLIAILVTGLLSRSQELNSKWR